MEVQTGLSLITKDGGRKYLNRRERLAFYACAKKLPLERQIFCLLLYFTGARISEIYELTPRQIDFEDKTIIIRSLKRRKTMYRQIPIPDHLVKSLSLYFSKNRNDRRLITETETFWMFALRTGARIVKHVMHTAGISGTKACSRGLRHGFAVHAINNIPLTKLQKWMGHARLSTTAIYLDVSGIEERRWAEKMWDEEE